MGNNYFVIIQNERIEHDRVEGPYNFREAERERNWWQSFGNKSLILKLVVDENGKEVK